MRNNSFVAKSEPTALIITSTRNDKHVGNMYRSRPYVHFHKKQHAMEV